MSNYNPTTWTNGVTPINATNLNHIESGITDNSDIIIELKDSMKFKGTTSTLPASAEVGDVYQALVSGIYDSNKIGDLLVCVDITTNPYTWHVIPSGDETNGTVTSVQAGTGLTTGTGPITASGSLSLDSSYIANSNRNGLFSKEDYNTLHSLARVAETGSFNDLVDVPVSAERAIYQETGNNADGVMSQSATTEALAGKSNIGHTHSVEDVIDLSSLLAEENSEYVKAASDTHTHGLISRNGYFLDSNGSTVGANQYLKTDAYGKIISTNVINSGSIDGTIFNGINISTINSDVEGIKEILTPEEGGEMMEKAATSNHSHLDFIQAEDHTGFVPQVPDSSSDTFVLTNTGWLNSVNTASEETIINVVYPVGSYYETSLTPITPSTGNIDSNKESLEPEDIASLGVTWFNPNIAWVGQWVLETEGLVHVAASNPLSTVSPLPYPINGANNERQTDPNDDTKIITMAGAGVKDGGESAVKLTTDTIPAHTHNSRTLKGSTGNVFHGGQSPVRSGIVTTVVSSKRQYDTNGTSSNSWQNITINATHTHDSIGGNQAHNNMQPYLNVYRWHRIADITT